MSMQGKMEELGEMNGGFGVVVTRDSVDASRLIGRPDTPECLQVKFIETGSTGNCIVVGDIMLDCGLSRAKDMLDLVIKHNVRAIYVSHKHSDHLSVPFLKLLAKVRPGLLAKGVYVNGETFEYISGVAPNVGLMMGAPRLGDNGEGVGFVDHAGRRVVTYSVPHGGVANQALVLTFGDGLRLLHVTDVESLGGVPVSGYDLLLVEGNYCRNLLLAALVDEVVGVRAGENLRHLSVGQFRGFVVGCLGVGGGGCGVGMLHVSGMFGCGGVWRGEGGRGVGCDCWV